MQATHVAMQRPCCHAGLSAPEPCLQPESSPPSFNPESPPLALQVIDMVTKGVIINVLGLGSTLLGIQALVRARGGS